MSRLKLRALAGACSLAWTLVIADAAGAQSIITPTPSPVIGSTGTLYGPVSEVLAHYWAEDAHCLDKLNSAPPASTSDEGMFFVKGTPVIAQTTATLTCTPLSNGVNGINVDSTGSGSGIGGVYAHTFAPGTAQQTAFAGLLGTLAGSTTTPVFPLVNFSLSEIGLAAPDVAVYDSGGVEQGVTVVAPGVTPNTSTPTFANPKSTYGALVQFPISIDPVDVAYNPTYTSNGSTFTLQVKTSLQNPDGSGGLHLSQKAYCGIFNGVITDWGDATLTIDNGGLSLTSNIGPAPIHIVGESGSAGATFIFTRHLANVCAALAGTVLPDGQILTNTYATGAGTLAGAGVNPTVLALYTLGAGSDDVAADINATPGSIGYLNADWVLPFVHDSNADPFSLNVADLQNSAAAGATFVEPSPAAARLAFGSFSPPTGAARGDPTAWVQGPAPTVPLANPQATGSYPLVGTTNFIGYICYASAGSVTALDAFLTLGDSTTGQNILKSASLSPLPTPWLAAINSVFLTTITGDLFFAKAGAGSTNPNCTSVTGG